MNKKRLEKIEENICLLAKRYERLDNDVKKLKQELEEHNKVFSRLIICQHCHRVIVKSETKMIKTPEGNVYYCKEHAPKYDRIELGEIIEWNPGDTIAETTIVYEKKYYRDNVEVDKKGNLKPAKSKRGRPKKN